MKRILVALDGSPRAATVFAAARRLAELTGAQLVLYRAMSVVPDLPREALIEGQTRLDDLLTEHARADLERFAADVPRGLIEHIVTAFATPWDGICRAGFEHDVDLIVIGSHGYGGLDRLLGTVASKVVNHADRNVLVVRTVL
ncbi:MAG TPA: universal stress protein [Kofleriaceae bacterium]|nr:universal stress protein [Kofleriaceae bacterium]